MCRGERRSGDDDGCGCANVRTRGRVAEAAVEELLHGRSDEHHNDDVGRERAGAVRLPPLRDEALFVAGVQERGQRRRRSPR